MSTCRLLARYGLLATLAVAGCGGEAATEPTTGSVEATTADTGEATAEWESDFRFFAKGLQNARINLARLNDLDDPDNVEAIFERKGARASSPRGFAI
jgi:hypothetical protein